MADSSPNQYLGSNFPIPTDPSYYLSQTGLSSLIPQAFNANSLAGMFSPQGLMHTPIQEEATNPFLGQYMQANEQATRLQRRQVGQEAPPPQG